MAQKAVPVGQEGDESGKMSRNMSVRDVGNPNGGSAVSSVIGSC